MNFILLKIGKNISKNDCKHIKVEPNILKANRLFLFKSFSIYL